MAFDEYLQRIERPLIRWLLVLPLISWIVLYAAAPRIPTSIRPEIDVRTLYDFDVAFLHYLPSAELAKLKCTFLDVLGAIAYTLHSAWPVIFLVYMVFFKRRDLILPYVNCFGILCFLALINQLLMPTAPPWYYNRYGFSMEGANYTLKGDPAGLLAVDKKFDIKFYENMFDSSPVVFGSFPSLHVGWPTLTSLFVCYETTLFKPIKIASVAYVAYLGLAVMYLEHHYFVDVFGGIFYATVVYKFIGPKKKPENGQQSKCLV